MSENMKPIKHHDRSLQVSSLVTFVGLALFIALSAAVDQWIKPTFSSTGLMIVGVVLALIPAVLWMGFFYLQDVGEPEPKGKVIQIFILGGLLASAVGIPLVDDIFAVRNWLYDNLWVTLAGSILVIGISQEFLKYAAVRFFVYSSEEFDERTDGIIYTAAAGLGFATVLNIAFVIKSGGVSLGIGAIHIILTSLSQASFAGVTGYFLGREKFDNMPVWWTAAGVGLAALLNGLFYTLWGNLSQASITNSGAFVNPWIGLALAVILAFAVLGSLTWLIRRDQRRNMQQEVANG